MPIDRTKFLMLALSMSMGATACGPKSSSPSTAPSNTAETEDTQPAEEAMAPSDEGMMPASECVDWDPSGECIQWADSGTQPANECVNWDPSGECIEWM